MGSQPQQAQRYRSAAFGAVFQGGIHQPFIRKGKGMLYRTVRRGGGRCLAVPQFQQMNGMAFGHQFGRQAAGKQRVCAGGVFHPVKYP